MGAKASARRVQHYTDAQRLRAYLYGRLRQLAETLVALVLLALVLGGDVLYLLHHGSADILDALQNTLGLLTLSNNALHENDTGGRLLVLFNLLFSILFAQSVLNSTRAFFKQRPLATQQRGLARQLHSHVIVAGLGRIGIRIITQLVEAGYPAVVIERDLDQPFTKQALALGVPVIQGDASDRETLLAAGLMPARALIACIDGDLVDLEIALAARQVRQDIRIVSRSFFENFDAAFEKAFGQHTAFSTTALAAPTFAAAVLSRDLQRVLPLGDDLLGVTRVRISPAQREATLATIEAESQLVALRGDPHTPEVATLLGPLTDIAALRAKHSNLFPPSDKRPPLPTTQFDRYIICGLGKVGYRVVKLLTQLEPGRTIVVIQTENDEHTFFAKEIARLPHVTMLTGDARGQDTLIEAGIDRAITVAALTSADAVNVQIGNEARLLQKDVHIVVRVFSDTLEDQLVNLFGIGTAYSTSRLAAPAMATAAIIKGVRHAMTVSGAASPLYLMVEHTIAPQSTLAGQTVAALRKHYDMLIVCYDRDAAHCAMPPVETRLAPGDVVTLVAPLTALARLPEFVA